MPRKECSRIKDKGGRRGNYRQAYWSTPLPRADAVSILSRDGEGPPPPHSRVFSLVHMRGGPACGGTDGHVALSGYKLWLSVDGTEL